MKSIRIGIDVGGTKTEVAILKNNQILDRSRFTTDRDQGYSHFLEKLTNHVDGRLDHFKISEQDIAFIGAGLPGSVHPIQQVMLQGNTSILKNKHVLKDLLNGLGLTHSKIPTRMENDANCFVLAETKLGAVSDWITTHQLPPEEICAIGITLGTGLGGGIIMNHKMIHGSRGGAGELGHLTLVTHGRKCYCGKSGCAEKYLAGTGIEESYRERAPHEIALSSRQIFDQARNGDPISKSVVQEFLELWVTYLSNLANVFDPHLFVVGGGVSQEPEIYAGISAQLSGECFLTADPPAVLQNKLGDAAGSIGAAFLDI